MLTVFIFLCNQKITWRRHHTRKTNAARYEKRSIPFFLPPRHLHKHDEELSTWRKNGFGKIHKNRFYTRRTNYNFGNISKTKRRAKFVKKNRGWGPARWFTKRWNVPNSAASLSYKASSHFSIIDSAVGGGILGLNVSFWPIELTQETRATTEVSLFVWHLVFEWRGPLNGESSRNRSFPWFFA